MKKKICIVTGTRAEWGLLSRLAGLIRLDSGLQLQIIATNMHLDPRYGNTYKEIEEAGFTIDYRVPMNATGDDAQSTVKSMGNAVSGFADAYQALRPNMLVVLGDRYEILAAVQAALIFRIPVAHIHGGEITEGAFDDAIRHAITKMSHLHFTATEPYRERVIQMGEQPDTVCKQRSSSWCIRTASCTRYSRIRNWRSTAWRPDDVGIISGPAAV